MRDAGTSRVPGAPIPARAGVGRARPIMSTRRPDASPTSRGSKSTRKTISTRGGPQPDALERARAHYPLSFHGVGLGLGSV